MPSFADSEGAHLAESNGVNAGAERTVPIGRKAGANGQNTAEGASNGNDDSGNGRRRGDDSQKLPQSRGDGDPTQPTINCDGEGSQSRPREGQPGSRKQSGYDQGDLAGFSGVSSPINTNAMAQNNLPDISTHQDRGSGVTGRSPHRIHRGSGRDIGERRLVANDKSVLRLRERASVCRHHTTLHHTLLLLVLRFAARSDFSFCSFNTPCVRLLFIISSIFLLL